jgi:hypothetical protein
MDRNELKRYMESYYGFLNRGPGALTGAGKKIENEDSFFDWPRNAARFELVGDGDVVGPGVDLMKQFRKNSRTKLAYLVMVKYTFISITFYYFKMWLIKQ